MNARRGVLPVTVFVTLLFSLVAFSTKPTAESAEAVGAIDGLSGEATLTRGTTTVGARVGDLVLRGDTLTTSPGARLSSLFKDGSRLQLGEKAIVLVREFVAESGRKSGALFLELMAGPMRLTTSTPFSAPIKRVEIKTPAARIITSTSDVWSGDVEGGRAILLMAGKVHVRNDAGSVIIERRKVGTVVTDIASPPAAAAGWAGDQVGLALASVALP
jgi:hypothetical protein